MTKNVAVPTDLQLSRIMPQHKVIRRFTWLKRDFILAVVPTLRGGGNTMTAEKRLPIKHWSLTTCAEQLAKCAFENESGPLEMSDAFIWLRQASVAGPEFLPGQGVFFQVEAECNGCKLAQWVHFYIVGCHMTADSERRYWTYDLSNNPPEPWHYGSVQFYCIRGDLLRLEKPE